MDDLNHVSWMIAYATTMFLGGIILAGTIIALVGSWVVSR